jgi:hypothetical protein
MGLVVADADAAPDPLRQYRSWASVLFALLGAVVLIAWVVVVPSTSLPETYLLLAPAGIGAVVLFAASLAIDRGDAWAIHAIAPLCALLIVTGLLRAAVALSRSDFLPARPSASAPD